MQVTDMLQIYVELLVISSPFVAIPTLLNLTKGRSCREKQHVGILAAITVAVVLVASTWLGKGFLEFLDIRIAAFQLAGGFVIFLLALSMLNAQVGAQEEVGAIQESVGVVPLGIPLMAGPGAISSVIVSTTEFTGVVNQVVISLCSLAVALTLWVCLYFAVFLERFLGAMGLNIMSRLGGLILAALAVESMANGVLGLFPGLRG